MQATPPAPSRHAEPSRPSPLRPNSAPQDEGLASELPASAINGAYGSSLYASSASPSPSPSAAPSASSSTASLSCLAARALPQSQPSLAAPTAAELPPATLLLLDALQVHCVRVGASGEGSGRLGRSRSATTCVRLHGCQRLQSSTSDDSHSNERVHNSRFPTNRPIYIVRLSPYRTPGPPPSLSRY